MICMGVVLGDVRGSTMGELRQGSRVHSSVHCQTVAILHLRNTDMGPEGRKWGPGEKPVGDLELKLF